MRNHFDQVFASLGGGRDRNKRLMGTRGGDRPKWDGNRPDGNGVGNRPTGMGWGWRQTLFPISL